MEKTDARRLSPEVQFELRKQAIRLRKKGLKNKVVAETIGISVYHASRLWQGYLKEGEKAIKLDTRGRRISEKRTLLEDQELELQRLITDKTPDQLKFPFALWTRDAVRELIQRRYAIAMPIRTVGEYLKRWGFTPKKPMKSAQEQKPEVVAQWLKVEYPQIVKKAKKEKAEIYWGDETGIQNEANRVLGYAPRGTTPVLKIPAKKEHISMISAITNEGKIRFMIYRESMTADKLITFMKRLIKDAQRKIYLILDNLRAHHCRKVSLWLEAKKEEIEVFYLPAYSPELNPDEYLNNGLKQKVHSGTQARTIKDLKHKTESFMRTLHRRPYQVKKYFEHPAVVYAA